MYALFMAVCVGLLGHDEYTVREWASKVCRNPAFEPYLCHAMQHSESPEIRFRASEIMAPRFAARDRQLYNLYPETWYRKWVENDCRSYYIDEVKLIKDVQNVDERQKIVNRLAKERGIDDPGPWSRKGYCYPADHVTLDRFRLQLKAVPEIMPATIPPRGNDES